MSRRTQRPYKVHGTDKLARHSAVRAALKRPYVQVAAECEEPAELRIPNFVAARGLIQTLEQRAQCCLLLNQPEVALHELLVFDAWAWSIRLVFTSHYACNML